MTKNPISENADKIIVSESLGQKLAITFEGGESFVSKEFNGLHNYGGLEACSYFGYRYVYATREQLLKAYSLQGYTECMYKLLTEKSIADDEEREKVATQYGRKFANDKIENAVKFNFMIEICEGRQGNAGTIRADYSYGVGGKTKKRNRLVNN
jgi:hypothetical protein